MGVDTKAIIRKGVTLAEIKEALECKYNDSVVSVSSTYSPDYFSINYNEGTRQRSMSIHFGDVAYNDYKINGVLLSLGCSGNAVDTLSYLCDVFGGYLDENDCDDVPFRPVNAIVYQQGNEFTKEDLFINKVIHRVGYDNLDAVMELLEEYKKLELSSPVDSSRT